MKFNCAAAAAACVLALSLSSISGAEDPKTPPAGDVKADKYKLPDDATAKSLVAFCKSLQQLEPKTKEEAEEMQAKVPVTIKKACAKILELEKGDSTPEGRYAKRFILIFQFQDAGDPSAPAARKSLDELIAFATDPKFTVEDVELARELGGLLEQIDEKRALEFYTTASKLYSTSKEPAILEATAAMAGTVRRLGLLGNEMVLKGTTVDGKPFDIASMKGKVVLVDFWATWCGYCVKEIPNVKKNYAGYHNKGFEVVAVSADQDRAALDDFLAQNKIAWVNLHDKDGRNAALEYYAIQGFPTTFLIGQDGKVVSLNARGEKLDEGLKKLLGEPEAVKELPKAPAETPAPLKDAIKEAIK